MSPLLLPVKWHIVHLRNVSSRLVAFHLLFPIEIFTLFLLFPTRSGFSTGSLEVPPAWVVASGSGWGPTGLQLLPVSCQDPTGYRQNSAAITSGCLFIRWEPLTTAQRWQWLWTWPTPPLKTWLFSLLILLLVVSTSLTRRLPPLLATPPWPPAGLITRPQLWSRTAMFLYPLALLLLWHLLKVFTHSDQ